MSTLEYQEQVQRIKKIKSMDYYPALSYIYYMVKTSKINYQQFQELINSNKK